MFPWVCSPSLGLLIIQAVGAERGPNHIQADTVLTEVPNHKIKLSWQGQMGGTTQGALNRPSPMLRLF